MKTFGRHLLVELHGCDPAALNDRPSVERLMLEAARAAEATPVGNLFHNFAPQGVSGVVVVEESHLSIHTWPEHRYAAVDFFTCGDCVPERACDVLVRGFDAQRCEVMNVERGLERHDGALRVASHRADGPPLAEVLETEAAET